MTEYGSYALTLPKDFTVTAEWQARVIDEATDLLNRLMRLRDFMKSKTFSGLSSKHQALLRFQEETMNVYLGVLKARIELKETRS